jgi:hypothetical protein
VTELVECNGEQHRVTWRKGKVVLEDHDLAAERMLQAFGGGTTECLRVLKRWRDLHSWATSGELYLQMRSRVGGHVLAPGELASTQELGLLLTWERAWRQQAYMGTQGRWLQEQLQRCAVEPLREHMAHWVERLGSRQTPSVDVEILRPGQQPRLVGELDRYRVRGSAGLGARWILGVHARGLAVVDGAFVLELAPSTTGLRARAVRWEAQAGGTAQPVAALGRLGRSPDGMWRLAWDDG